MDLAGPPGGSHRDYTRGLQRGALEGPYRAPGLTRGLLGQCEDWVCKIETDRV